ncbi:ABC transporter ATP-binding protein [Paenibacillus sp. 7523-1]|uniref:ABC transporter ATP-binding protein n=1 Tax=Paenibacillus sp. 7523-1 TaxID=2022550 RepID=UPI000BA6E020|nr:ABC transporter ATP-binding protein [Paenibacillus sp. 7523-1]PAD30471.1 molybdenum ABC transporter ATP-binding protein [Paenibacillus sp. 7523-1]
MIIDVQHVTWKRGPITLLNDVSWQVNDGEHWALLGLNGSGKTTLLNMITGYLWPTEGTISVLGHPYGEVDLRELRKTIGWVSSSLQEKLHGTDRTQYVVISGKHATIGLYDKLSDEDLDQARELMTTLGCQHLWDREYRTCSQGEKQKLLIARALMANPRILILDEPCNGLDLFSRERLLESIGELSQRPDSPSLIYVTHHTEEILPIFSHSLLLRRGEVVSSGLTSEVMNTEVLSNFFEAPVDVDQHGDRVYVRAAVNK